MWNPDIIFCQNLKELKKKKKKGGQNVSFGANHVWHPKNFAMDGSLKNHVCKREV